MVYYGIRHKSLRITLEMQTTPLPFIAQQQSCPALLPLACVVSSLSGRHDATAQKLGAGVSRCICAICFSNGGHELSGKNLN